MEVKMFNKWEPIPDIPNDLYFLSLFDQFSSLTIMLKELGDDKSRNFLKIEFENTLMYRVTPESSRIRITNELSSYDGFWISKKSELLEWFNEESAGIFDDGDLIHYTICNIDNVIEIITTTTGSVSWNNDSEKSG